MCAYSIIQLALFTSRLIVQRILYLQCAVAVQHGRDVVGITCHDNAEGRASRRGVFRSELEPRRVRARGIVSWSVTSGTGQVSEPERGPNRIRGRCAGQQVLGVGGPRAAGLGADPVPQDNAYCRSQRSTFVQLRQKV